MANEITAVVPGPDGRWKDCTYCRRPKCKDNRPLCLECEVTLSEAGHPDPKIPKMPLRAITEAEARLPPVTPKPIPPLPCGVYRCDAPATGTSSGTPYCAEHVEERESQRRLAETLEEAAERKHAERVAEAVARRLRLGVVYDDVDGRLFRPCGRPATSSSSFCELHVCLFKDHDFCTAAAASAIPQLCATHLERSRRLKPVWTAGEVADRLGLEPFEKYAARAAAAAALVMADPGAGPIEVVAGYDPTVREALVQIAAAERQIADAEREIDEVDHLDRCRAGTHEWERDASLRATVCRWCGAAFTDANVHDFRDAGPAEARRCAAEKAHFRRWPAAPKEAPTFTAVGSGSVAIAEPADATEPHRCHGCGKTPPEDDPDRCDPDYYSDWCDACSAAFPACAEDEHGIHKMEHLLESKNAVCVYCGKVMSESEIAARIELAARRAGRKAEADALRDAIEGERRLIRARETRERPAAKVALAGNLSLGWRLVTVSVDADGNERTSVTPLDAPGPKPPGRLRRALGALVPQSAAEALLFAVVAALLVIGVVRLHGAIRAHRDGADVVGLPGPIPHATFDAVPLDLCEPRPFAPDRSDRIIEEVCAPEAPR